MTQSSSLLRRALAVTALAVLVAPACGESKRDVEANLQEIPATHMPPALLGMKLEPEKAAELVKSGGKQPYVKEIGLFALRREELLQATLQVSRFTAEARVDDPQFRATLAQQVSASEPQVLRMGQHQVYMSAGQKQSLVVWFKEHTMFVLAIRQEFEQPRALLREALEIKP